VASEAIFRPVSVLALWTMGPTELAPLAELRQRHVDEGRPLSAARRVQRSAGFSQNGGKV
jgi:hypothetical protein